MSAYRDDRRRSSQDHHNNDRARERSPERRDRNPSYGRPQGYNDARAAQYGHSDNRGHEGYRGRGDSNRESYQSLSSRAPSSVERLADLPEEIPRPANGGALVLSDLPVKGTFGIPIRILLNHFTLLSLPIIKIFQYDLRLHVPVSSQRRGSEKVSAMQQAKVFMHSTLTGLVGSAFVFDGTSLGWSPDKLMEVGESKGTTLDLPGHLPERPNQVDVTIRNSGTVDIRKLVNYIKAGLIDLSTITDPAVEDCFKFLNAVYRQDPASRMLTRPKSTAFFERKTGLYLPLQSTGGILEAVRGVHQAIQFLAGKLTINVDVVVSAFYTPGLSAINVVMAYAGVPPHQNIEHWASSHPDSFRQACERLTGMFFSVRHLNTARNERKMRVIRVSLQGAKEAEFEEQDYGSGRTAPTTVYDYFKRKYHINLQLPDLPLLICKEGHFPMELCFTASGERFRDTLPGPETADFIR